MFNIVVQHDIPDIRIADVLCTSFESGLFNNWGCIDEYKVPLLQIPDAKLFTFKEGEAPKYASYPLTKGYALKIFELEDDKMRVLNIMSITLGLQTMAAKYPHHFKDMLPDGDYDMFTADCFLQCCLLGKIQYV